MLFRSDNQRYNGIELKHNEYFGQYFFIYSLDYESSISIITNLSDYEEQKTKQMNNITNLSSWFKYGQYNIKTMSNKYRITSDFLEKLVEPAKMNPDVNELINIILYDIKYD